MAWSLHSQQQLSDTLKYFDKYDYPLTRQELHLWSGVPLNQIPKSKNGYYFLSNRQKLVSVRQQREKYSRQKWVIARQVGEKLKMLPTIAAIFVTGALAMNNCPKDDDIDLMIVTHVHTLWLTRALVVVYLNLKKWRRSPGLSHHTGFQVANKICDNLYLDTRNLHIKSHDAYRAHEVLQVKNLWDRGGVHYKFLKDNSWTKKYFPKVYASIFSSTKKTSLPKFKWVSWVLFSLNLKLFILQYLYMKPKMTSEKIGLGYAFFHPQAT